MSLTTAKPCPPKKRNNKKIMKNIKIIIAFNIICLLLFRLCDS